MNSRNKTGRLVTTGLMMAGITVMTMILPIPIPGAGGYIHLGDTVIFLSVLILGWKHGTIAASFGSAIADLLLGAAVWAPWTFVVKAAMALTMGLIIEFYSRRRLEGSSPRGSMTVNALAMVAGGILMTMGYYLAEGVIYGNSIAPVLSVPWNVGQFTVGTVLATAISGVLYRSPAAVNFQYKPIIKEKK